MTETLEQLIHAEALRALDQQERAVSELRQRTGTLIAASSLAGSVFAAVAIDSSGLASWSIAALVALCASLLAGLFILMPHRLIFVLDPKQLYDQLWEDREDLPSAHARLADVLWRARNRNFGRVQSLHAAFALAVVALAIESSCGASPSP